jgi:hypothetical protein
MDKKPESFEILSGIFFDGISTINRKITITNQ